MSKYHYLFPKKTKHYDFGKLITDADKARLLYNRDADFRLFVNEWNADVPQLLAWTLTDFYHAWQMGEKNLQLCLFN